MLSNTTTLNFPLHSNTEQSITISVLILFHGLIGNNITSADFIKPKIESNRKYYLLLAVVYIELIEGFRAVTESEVKGAIQRFKFKAVRETLNSFDIVKLKFFTLAMRNKYKSAENLDKWKQFYCDGEELVQAFFLNTFFIDLLIFFLGKLIS